MENARILVLMPTYNNVAEIDASLESIWNQNYDRENIYVTAMDFGSTDGTYEMLLKYDPYHFGVYRNLQSTNPRLRLSHMAKMSRYTHPGGHYSFQTVLYPGDVFYPDFMKICNEALILNWQDNPCMVVCETDIYEEDGSVSTQPSLFTEDCKIDGSRDITKFISGGYRHQVQCMVPTFSDIFKRFNCESNELQWWNKLYLRGLDQWVLYVKQPLSCSKKVFYEDELDEILLRWESIITNLRSYLAKYGKIYDDGFEKKAKSNLAEYALWRSYILASGENSSLYKIAEDCFRLSGVISPNVMEGELYKNMELYVMHHDLKISSYLEKYFSTHGMN